MKVQEYSPDFDTLKEPIDKFILTMNEKLYKNVHLEV